MVAFKDSIVKYIEIVNTDCKYVFWFRVNKSLLSTTEDAILGVVYIPPEGSRYSTNDCFLEIEQELINITNGNNYVCLFGDFNSRTGHLEDFFTPDHFLSNVTHSLDSYQYHTEKRSVIF